MQTICSNELNPIWVVEQHSLGAMYLLQILGKDPSLRSRWIQGTLPPNRDLGPHPLFVLNKLGLEVTPGRYIQHVNRLTNEAKYIVLDQQMDPHSVCQLLFLGMNGFLTYDQVTESLLFAVRSVLDGAVWIDPQVLRKYMSMGRRAKEALAPSIEETPLTIREEEVLRLAQERLSNKEIASLLNIEVSTVKFHLSNIFSKRQIASRSDLWRHTGTQIDIPNPFQERTIAIDSGIQPVRAVTGFQLRAGGAAT
jgi:DNA-binding NarL/FixJ family response regulator